LLAGQFATEADGAPLLLISRLAVHTKNILADPRVSLMIDERKPGDPLQGARVTLMGTAAPTEDPRSRHISREGDRRRTLAFLLCGSCRSLVRFWSEADMPRAAGACRSDADDPKPTKTE
jgi:hypothetical protein